MTVELVHVTPNAEELIVKMARVSAPKNESNMETAPRLLRYLLKHSHVSPFEMANMCVAINTTRGISAQIIRHRSFSFQEFSQRYSEVTQIEPIQLRKQAEKNRQSSEEVIDDVVLNNVVQYSIKQSLQTYEKLIQQGVAKEQARMVLPLATQSTLYMKGSVRSWVHFLQLRTKEDTQKEHRDIALEIQKLFIKQFPNVSQALSWE